MATKSPKRNSAGPAAGADFTQLVIRLDALLDRVEGLLPVPPGALDWKASIAFRWRKQRDHGPGQLQPVAHPHKIHLADLKGIDRQKGLIEQNTRQFVDGKPANNVLLTGSRGTGKSSLVKACLNRFAKEGLRLIEVDKADLIDLPDIADLVAGRPERFIIFCDDLSFEASEHAYKALKAILDGSIAAPAENLLVYATSNRRHLMPEYMQENLEYKHLEEEIHPGETSEEKISLSERFGLWVSFYPFDQDDYMGIVEYWLGTFGCKPTEAARTEALQWSISRGSRSGRIAYQFARDWSGRQAAKKPAR